MKRREEEREREKEKEDERDWNLQRVTSLLLVWLGGGIAGCGDGCELKSSKFMICKQISSTSLLISAITSLHRNLVPVTEKKKKQHPSSSSSTTLNKRYSANTLFSFSSAHKLMNTRIEEKFEKFQN